MALTQLPDPSLLTDQQNVQVTGPDGITYIFRYDKQTNTMIARESEVIYNSHHGVTHIAQDPIPEATPDSRGLMSANDKAKLDQMLQTRIGVAGFQGAGFPDDGGWLSGDIILAAGTDFISLERFGNVIRFVVDSPIQFTCTNESSTNIFWVQDETDISSLRPPVFNSKLPGSNIYGEFKVFMFPESTQVDPVPATTLTKKGNYPSFIFKRYENSTTTNQAQVDLVLYRNASNRSLAEVGWTFTPGTTTVAVCKWAMGRDTDNNLIEFEFNANATPGILGSLLYKGHTITRQNAVVIGYSSTIANTNQYVCRYWDVDTKTAIGDSFVATNTWQYNNPENTESGINPKSLVPDANDELLPIGTIIDLYEYQIGVVNGVRLTRKYFNKRPTINFTTTWGQLGTIEFGNTLTTRREMGIDGTMRETASLYVNDARNYESNIWGLTGLEDPVVLSADASAGTELVINSQDRAVIDQNLPGLTVSLDETQTTSFSARPVTVWNRISHKNSLITAEIGRPSLDMYPPYDFLFMAPIDSKPQIYMQVDEIGTIGDYHMIRVKGAHNHDLPKRGFLRILTPGSNINSIWRFENKYLFPSADSYSLILVTDSSSTGNEGYPGNVGDIVELVHEEYDAPCVRLEFGLNSGAVTLQVKVGTLDMSTVYENSVGDAGDDFVRGMRDGYTVSAVYTQDEYFNGATDRPTSSPSDFVVYDGGYPDGTGTTEYWNKVEIMHRDNQVWVWWNGLLIPPSTSLSNDLPTPVSVSGSSFPINFDNSAGKVGLRMWPGAKLRRFGVQSQLRQQSEYYYGQIQLNV